MSEATRAPFADSPLADRLVLIVGAQRSGTNWLERMLAAHPAVAALPAESHLFSHGIAPLLERFHHGLTSSPTTGATYADPNSLLPLIRRLTDEVYGGLAASLRPGFERVVERTPLHVNNLELIGRLYPDAWVIHMVRDGVEVTQSLLAQSWGPETLRDAARTWASAVRDGRAAALPRMREVRYEDLLGDPVLGACQLLEWLGLTAGPEIHEAVAAAARVAFNVSPGRSAIATGKWRRSLTAQDAATIELEAGEQLRELGYPPPSPSLFERPAAGGQMRHVALRALAASRRRLRRAIASLTSSPPPPTVHFAVTTSYAYLTAIGELRDRYLEHIALRRYDDLPANLSTDVEVTVASPDGAERARGPAGRDLLLQALRRDEPRRAALVRDDSTLHADAITVAQTHRASDGSLTDCFHVLEPVHLGDGRVALRRILYRRTAGSDR